MIDGQSVRILALPIVMEMAGADSGREDETEDVEPQVTCHQTNNRRLDLSL